MSDTGDKNATSTGSGSRSSIREFVYKKSSELIIAAVVSLVALLGWATWDNLVGSARNFIIQTTADELSNPKNRLQDALKKTLSGLRQSEVGALNVGNFSLTPTNSRYSVFIYFPEGYTGKIWYQLDGEIIPKRRYVVVVFPNGATGELRNLDGVIDIPASIKARPGVSSSENQVADQRMQALEGLRSYTFQLIDRPIDGDRSPQSPEIKVSYVALVSPVIRNDEK